MSLGLERIIEVVKEFQLLPTPRSVAQVFVAVFPGLLAPAAEIARDLRDVGLNVDLSLQPRRSVGEQLKYAGRRGIPYAVIPGEAELERNQVAVKELESGRQWSVPLAGLHAELLTVLDRSGAADV
jgi:histidyl-tRNA synthetase